MNASQNNVMPGVSAYGMITRTALIQKMKAISLKKNIFLTAPGGYGKTVAATQWLSIVRGKNAKLTMGTADNDPSVFYSRLAVALLKLTGREKSIQHAGSSVDRLLDTIRLLPVKNSRCYLALDDLHMLKNEEILNRLPLIAERLPDYVHLCLISRAEPSEALMDTGRFELFTQDSLLFTPEEVAWLCEERDCEYTQEQIDALLKTTGGWAMYLTALLSSEAPEPESENKTPQTLLQYLETRVWDLWDNETRDTLARLAVPVEITPELAGRLTGRKDGRDLLTQLTKRDNAFLSLVGEDTYRFHDIFRRFLLERTDKQLGQEEIRRLHDIAAGWYYEQGDYLTATRHYITNGDQEGISRCTKATSRFHEETGSVSVEFRVNFTKQYVWGLSPEFIAENLYLVSKCAFAAFQSGESEEFQRYADMLYKRRPEIAAKHPDLLESVGFIGSLDFREPLKDYAKKVVVMLPHMPKATVPDAEASTPTIMQNLPFFHRSMRDYSSYHDLNQDDLKLLRDTFGHMIGKDYDAMEKSLVAGIYYERGELLKALRHALEGYYYLTEDMQAETVFSIHVILASLLYAIGALREAEGIMEQAERFTLQKAEFLRANFKALQTERAIRAGDTEAAGEWLAVYACREKRLPFYQMCRHFTTLRSYIAVENIPAAVGFGWRLQTLAAEYNRPLDQIESKLLTAIALSKGGESGEAAALLGEALTIAMPFGFTQLFINEGKEILPLLWELRESPDNTKDLTRFIDRLTGDIYKKHGLAPERESLPKLSAQQLAMLPYLSRGMTYSEIADEAGLSRATVKSHVLLVYKRLGVHGAQEAVIRAKTLGLLE